MSYVYAIPFPLIANGFPDIILCDPLSRQMKNEIIIHSHLQLVMN